MRTISAHFQSGDDARNAVYALEDAGVASDDIGIVSVNGNSDNAVGPPRSCVALGASVGGFGGLLAGLGAFALPGVGPVVGATWLATTAVGAVAGGVAGGLIGKFADSPGSDEETERVRRCGSLVTARVDEADVERTRDILGRCRHLDLKTRRDIRRGDWEGFVAKDIWDEDIGSEDADRPSVMTR